METKLIRSLPPLPDGTTKGMEILRSMLVYILTKQDRNTNSFSSWFSTLYDVDEKSSNIYLQSLMRLDLINQDEEKKLEVTSLGIQILASKGQVRNRWLLRELLTRYVGCLDVLNILCETRINVSLIDIAYKLKSKYPEWQSNKPYQERLYWLTITECVDKLPKKPLYSVTNFGKEIHEEFANKS
jgi:predicted transcriptional regulator